MRAALRPRLAARRNKPLHQTLFHVLHAPLTPGLEHATSPPKKEKSVLRLRTGKYPSGGPGVWCLRCFSGMSRLLCLVCTPAWVAIYPHFVNTITLLLQGGITLGSRGCRRDPMPSAVMRDVLEGEAIGPDVKPSKKSTHTLKYMFFMIDSKEMKILLDSRTKEI